MASRTLKGARMGGLRFNSSLTASEITRRIQEKTKGFYSSPVELKPETTLNKDLGLDSLDSVEFLVAVEEEFDVEMSDDDANGIKTIGQIVEYLQKNPDAH